LDDVTSDDNRKLARDIVAQSTVLLKNAACGSGAANLGSSRSEEEAGEEAGKMLPLSVKKVRKVVVVGSPDAAGHGSGFVSAKKSVGVGEGIERKLRVGQFSPEGDLAWESSESEPPPAAAAMGLVELRQDEAAANADVAAAALGGEALRSTLDKAVQAAKKAATEKGAKAKVLAAAMATLGSTEDPAHANVVVGARANVVAGLGMEGQEQQQQEEEEDVSVDGELAARRAATVAGLGLDGQEQQEQQKEEEEEEEEEECVRFFGAGDVDAAREAAAEADAAVVVVGRVRYQFSVFTTLLCSQKTVQSMTASMVHDVTNLTPGSGVTTLVVGTNAAESVDRDSLSLSAEDEVGGGLYSCVESS
jgi:hypothetical protein